MAAHYKTKLRIRENTLKAVKNAIEVDYGI